MSMYSQGSLGKVTCVAGGAFDFPIASRQSGCLVGINRLRGTEKSRFRREQARSICCQTLRRIQRPILNMDRFPMSQFGRTEKRNDPIHSISIEGNH
jgi:hypothetical protein